MGTAVAVMIGVLLLGLAYAWPRAIWWTLRPRRNPAAIAGDPPYDVRDLIRRWGPPISFVFLGVFMTWAGILAALH